MTTVYWQFKDRPLGALGLAYYEPELALPDILKNKSSEYIKCPAFLDYFKNTYLIRSPVDIKITYNNGILNILPQGQEFYNDYIVHRGNEIKENDSFLMTLNFNYLFIASKDCFIEVMPAVFHEISTKVRLIPGTFNIHKWFRNIEFAFEFLNENEPLVIKRGDPLYYVKFRPLNNEKVLLEQKYFDESVLKAVSSCSFLKLALPSKPLNFLYKLAERIKLKF
jgi:hypothetical protein